MDGTDTDPPCVPNAGARLGIVAKSRTPNSAASSAPIKPIPVSPEGTIDEIGQAVDPGPGMSKINPSLFYRAGRVTDDVWYELASGSALRGMVVS
jgi:hypothetical protein